MVSLDSVRELILSYWSVIFMAAAYIVFSTYVTRNYSDTASMWFTLGWLAALIITLIAVHRLHKKDQQDLRDEAGAVINEVGNQAFMVGVAAAKKNEVPQDIQRDMANSVDVKFTDISDGDGKGFSVEAKPAGVDLDEFDEDDAVDIDIGGPSGNGQGPL